MVSSLLLIGCGKMGGALLQRWQQAFPTAHFDVVDPSASLQHQARTCIYRDLADLPKDVSHDAIILAVKPQQMDAVMAQYCSIYSPSTATVVSIAAGKTLAYFSIYLGKDAQIVRVMPNTPALIGEGTLVLCASQALRPTSRQLATQLMEVAGKALWLEDEAQMNAVTAISGCGPAYLFLFLESLIQAGTALGLSETLAHTLALQTISGSAELAAQSTASLEQLRQQVASPGGSTEAALKVLMEDSALKHLMERAVDAACRRSIVLAQV